MKGSAYNDSVLVSQDQLRKTDQDKTSSIKERFNSLIAHGVLDDGSSPLALDYSGGATINISGGEAYCDFDKTNTSPEYGNTGERIYASSSLSALDIKGGVITGGDPRHFFAVYVEIHKNRKLDEVNVAHYTEKEDSYTIAQLTDAELTTLNSAGSVYIADNYVHATQTDLTSLSDEELNDTFGSGRWDRTTDFIADITVTEFNSVYLGTADDAPSVSTEYGTRVRPTMFIHEDVLNLPDIEDLSQENHRKKQHSNGISGSISAFQATVDGTTVPDELNIADLANDEFGYIGGHRVSTGDIAIGYLSAIQATNNSYFPDGGYDYYVYIYYDSSTGTFKTTSFKVDDVPSALVTNGEENYLLLGKVYIDAGRNTIEAYNGDNRYSATVSDNPITDLRKFGTIDSINISDDGFSSIAGDSLIPNGDFEEGITNDTPTEWSGTGTFSLNNTSTLGGKHRLSLAPSGVVISNPIPYNQLATYNLRAAIKSSGTSGTYTIGIRGYVGKDWGDIAFANDATAPTNISYQAPASLSGVSKTTAWADSGAGLITNALWLWTTPAGGNYTSGDLDKIKYIRVFIKNDGGTSDIYVDNVKLFDNNGVTATHVEINQALDGISGNVTDTNLNALTGGSGPTALHTHNLANGATDVSATSTEVNRIADGITATAAEVNQALGGIGANVTDTNLDTLTDGASSDADALHKHAQYSLTTHNIVDHDTTATGAELDTLTDGASSDADALHKHAQYSLTTHNIVDHDTTATGAELDTLTGGGETSLHTHPGSAGTIVKVVNVQDGALATGTSILPYDNTIPQNSEGDEYMTLAITPSNASNKLKIEVVANVGHSNVSGDFLAALFQDSTAGALAAAQSSKNNSSDQLGQVVFTHYMTAGTASSTTFKVRAGSSVSGTTTFNGVSATARFGGVMASSITITEIKV